MMSDDQVERIPGPGTEPTSSEPACREGDVEQGLRLEQTKVPKLELLFGPWWRHYTPPGEFIFTLFAERAHCPYCGGPLGPQYVSATEAAVPFRGRAHQDHMDPLAKGGEDSIRNAVYVCDICNYKKGNRLFVDWLAMIDPAYQQSARSIYIEKHGHAPEEFVQTGRNPRTTTWLRSLAFDVTVLKTLFPKPVVTGPPARRKATSIGPGQRLMNSSRGQ